MDTPAKYLFDECLGANMMEQLRATVSETAAFKHICEIYGEGKPDNIWIPEIAAEGGWIVISSDLARRSNAGGKLPRLCKENKVTHVLLSRAIHRLKGAEKLALLTLMWPHIAEIHKEVAGTRFKLRYVQRSKNQGLTVALVKVDESQPRKAKHNPPKP